MGIFKKAEKETIYDDYDDESYRDEELLEEADKEKTDNKMFNISIRIKYENNTQPKRQSK